MSQTQHDYTHTRSGNVIVCEITRTQPSRAYSAECALCHVLFTLTHSAIKARLDSNVQLECPSLSCRSGVIGQVEAERQYFQSLRQTERQQENAALEARMRLRWGTPAIQVTQ
jgi:hypothetical protein